MMVSQKPTNRRNAAVERLRDDLQAAQFVGEMKDMSISELQGTLNWTQEWGDAMYDRAWKAEAGLADCERELQIVKAELSRSRMDTDEAKRELKHYIVNCLAGNTGNLVKELNELKDTHRELLRRVYPNDGVGTVDDNSDSDDSDSEDGANSPVTPLKLHEMASFPRVGNVYVDTPAGPSVLKPHMDQDEFANMFQSMLRPPDRTGPHWGRLVAIEGLPSAYNPPTPIRHESSSTA